MADHGDRDLLQGNARYRKLQDLNEGTFGVVMLALDTHAREQVAIKFLERGAGGPSCKSFDAIVGPDHMQQEEA